MVRMLADLLSECFAADLEETWERERTRESTSNAETTEKKGER